MHVVDLEASLAADKSGALRDDLCAKLAAERTALRRTIDAGLPPDAFRTAQEYHDAYVAAERVVLGFWRQEHPSGLRGSPRL
jgi:hypothetical protein